jgi:hypothetical protein
MGGLDPIGFTAWIPVVMMAFHCRIVAQLVLSSFASAIASANNPGCEAPIGLDRRASPTQSAHAGNPMNGIF